MPTSFPAVGKMPKGSFAVCSENKSIGMRKEEMTLVFHHSYNTSAFSSSLCNQLLKRKEENLCIFS